jgi:hypothetical protein
VALASAAPAAAAGADAAPSCPTTSDRPTAQLIAAGNGTLTLEGKVVVYGVIRSGRGILYVRDLAGDAEVTVHGAPQAFPQSGQLRLHPRRSRFYVIGSCVSIRIRGSRMVIAAGVSGDAAVRGVGAYTVNAGPGRRWSRSLTPVKLAQPRRSGGTTTRGAALASSLLAPA